MINKENNNDIPSRVDSKNDKKEPYTDEELNCLVENYIDDWQDLPVWNNLVNEVGKEKAKSILKEGLKNHSNIDCLLSEINDNLN